MYTMLGFQADHPHLARLQAQAVAAIDELDLGAVPPGGAGGCRVRRP